MESSGYGIYKGDHHSTIFVLTEEDYYFYMLALLFRQEQYKLIRKGHDEIYAYQKALKDIALCNQRDLQNTPCPLCYVFLSRYKYSDEDPPTVGSCREFGLCPAHLDDFCEQLLSYHKEGDFESCLYLVNRQTQRIKKLKTGTEWLVGMSDWNMVQSKHIEHW